MYTDTIIDSGERVSGGWRWVDSPGERPASSVPDATTLGTMRHRIKMLMDNHKKGSRPSLHEKVTDAVKKMAQDSGCVVGKWMLIEPTYKMDEAWKKVKEGVRSNKLGFSAKMTDGPAGTRVMCIYTYSFLDETDVWRVLQQLRRMEIFPKTWKADIMTHIGLYSSKAASLSAGGIYVPGLLMGWFSITGINKFEESQNPAEYSSRAQYNIAALNDQPTGL